MLSRVAINLCVEHALLPHLLTVRDVLYCSATIHLRLEHVKVLLDVHSLLLPFNALLGCDHATIKLTLAEVLLQVKHTLLLTFQEACFGC